MKLRKKSLISICIIALTIVLSVICFYLTKTNNLKMVAVKDNETRRSMTYNEVNDDSANIDNCEYVKFNSFFIKDLDGDGYAEKYDGTCNYIDKKATLYFDINVLTDGKLENGKIKINGKNFDLSTTLIKDEVLKNDYIGNDVTELELNTINYGTQKLFFGTISADIGNNINNYSVTNNQIILTGTWISTDGTKTANINKVINLKADWYGKTATSPNTYNEYSHDITNAVGSDEITLDFNVGYEETARELLIQKQVTEITIPDLNGYAATSAVTTSQNCTYNYDSETKILTITREATTNANGDLTKTVSRYNNYEIRVTYPIEAQAEIETNTISITFPTIGYYYGYNNSSDEFTNENPYVSSASRAFTHTWAEPTGNVAAVYVDVGKRVYNTDTNTYRQVVSKKSPVNIYNNVGQSDDEKDEYTVTWRAYTGDLPISSFEIVQAQEDKFLKSDGAYIDMTDYVKPTGIYFSNLESALGESGYISIMQYDSSGGAIKSYYENGSSSYGIDIQIDELKNYTKENPLKLNPETKKVRIYAFDTKANQSFYVYQIKEIDDEKLTSDFSYEDFSNINYIYSYVTGKIFTLKQQSLDTNEKSIQLYSMDEPPDVISSDTDYAYYEEPISAMKFTTTPYAITNQETKNIKMTLSTEATYYNEEKWKNGIFVIELPPEILGVEINNVTIDNTNVKISSYETFEENGKQYIKIYTNNDTEETYTITVDADVTADPRKPTLTNIIKLYAINPNCHNYRSTSKTPDVLDINGNGNVSENVLYKTNSLQIVAPTSLLTSQTLSNFDDAGTEVVSPQTAILDKSNNSREAQINQTLTNNYSGTISEVKVIGKIPFKGNTYQINGKELGSTYSVAMKQGGITLPDSIKDIAKVYYSTNETVNSTVTDKTNNWKTADQVADWSSIKTYLIDLSNYTIAMKENLVFSYKIEIPANVTYNDITYATHAVEFCLDTEDGKLKSKTEVNRLGIMIAKKYSINLTKYKQGTNTKVQEATYKITDRSMTRTGITDTNGNINIAGLFIDKEYTLKEIQTPSNYILNNDKIKFKVTIDDQGNPQVNIISGTLRNNANITNEEGIYTLNLEVEDIAKYDVKIVKSSVAGEKLKGIKFRLTGGIYGDNGRIFTTNSNGEVSMINLIPDTEYKLQETRADGYYVNQNISTFTISRNSSGQLVITSDDDNFKNATISEEKGVDKATINVNITNESIPTYSLNLKKQDKDGNPLASTQFKLKSLDTNEENYYTTDENGTVTIPNLYQYVDGKYITGEYVLNEVSATEGYITDSTEVKFKAEKQDGKMVITVLEGEDVLKNKEAGTDSITFTFENKEIFKLTKKGDNNQVLPGAIFKITDLNGNTVYDVNSKPIGKLFGKAPMNLTFTTTETNPWTTRTDGTWESGGKGVNNAVSKLVSDEFTLTEDSTLTFDWAVSSESASYDYLYYEIKNTSTNTTTGGTSTKIGGYSSSDTYDNLKFTTQQINLTAGTYTITFTYRKDGSANQGLDAGFVRNAKIAGSGYYGLTTDENGEITANLPEGLYKAIEVEAPEGYDLPENEEDRTYYIGIGSNRPEETEFTVKYAKGVTGSGIQHIYDVKSTEDGGYVVAGSFSGSLDVDGDGNVDATSVGSFDQLITKYDTDGNVEWFKTFGTSQTEKFNSVDIASDGGYVVSGYDYGVNKADAIVMKLDSSGNKVWKNTIGGSYEDEMRDAKVLSNGDIVTIGRFASLKLSINNIPIKRSGTGNNGYIICYDANGNYKWHKVIEGTRDIDVTSVTETSQGIAVSINYLGTITVDGNSITNAGNQDSAIVAFSTDGTYQWNQKIGGSNDEDIAKVITDSEDNIVAVGGFASNLTIGSETINAPTTSYASSIMLKFNSATGDYVASKVFGGTNNDDTLTTAVPADDGGILLGGWFYSTNFDIDGDGTNDITSVKGQNDGIVLKINDQNEVEWFKTIAGTSYDENYGIAQLKDKSFIAVGGFSSTSLSCGDKTDLLRAQGYTDGYIVDLANVVTSAEIPEVQEINVENNLKEFKVTTEIEENSDGRRGGGSITGTPSENNINFVEKVKYDYDSTTPIVITPLADYSVYSVEINGEKVEFKPDANGVVTIPVFGKVQEDKHIKVLFEKNVSSVVVHHYIKDRDGNYTTNKVADDEYITGKIGSAYETAPKIGIERYELEKDTNGKYVVPSNAKGNYAQTQTVITYYYQEIPLSLTVHHYLEGTEDKLEVDEVSSLYKDSEYTTSPSSELLKRYTLVSSATRVSPESAGTSGKIQTNTEVSYYYKLKEYKITTEVKKHDETDMGGNISKVKGGSISGEGMSPYETVIINQNSSKDITMTADEGYQVKSITIQSIDDNGNVTEESVNITGKNKTYDLNKFNNITSNKHIIVEYEKIIGTLTVHHYVEGTTNHVPLADGNTADDESRSGHVGDSYATKERGDINEAYELVGIPENSSGEYIDGNVEVTYYYKLKDTSVLVHHYIEGTTTKLADDVTVKGRVGDSYTTSSANVDSKYELVATPANAKGKMTIDQIVVTYYYRLKDTSVLVHHYKEGTTVKVSEDVTINGKVDDEYTTTIADDLPEYYELVTEPTNKAGTMTEEQIVVTYYYRLKKYPYTVNYLEKGTNKILHEAKAGAEQEWGTVIYTTDEVIDINGYGYDSADKNSLSIAVTGNVINIYYAKVTGLSYTVNYLEKDTDEVLHPAKTIGEQVFENEITTVDEIIDIDGYNYDSADKDKLIIGTGENVINIYYTKRNDLSYKVNYLEKDTNKVLHVQNNQTGMTFKDTVTSSDEVIEIDGYNYDSVDKESLTIQAGENVINIYYTKRNDLSYKVNYLEKGTNKVLHEQKVQDNMTFESVVTSADEVITIDGYNYDSVDKDSLTITTSENVINIYYTKRTDLSYKVNYLEKDTNKVLHEQKVQGNMTFESVVTSAEEVITIEGYNYDSVDKETLTIGTGENVINIYYTKKTDLGYKVNYLEKTTNKVLHAQKIQDGMTFESVVTSADEVIAIDGYNYDSVDKETLTITTGENVINIYYTKRNDLSYKVNYLEKDTNKVLHNQKIQNGMTFETEIQTKDEIIEINGYKYDSADKDKLVITTGTNEINIYYTKVDGLSYTVNYLEKGTNEVIHPAKKQDGMTFEDVITSKDEIISIDGYNYDSVDKDTLTIGTGENVINIYYTKRNDLSYKVNYLEKGTNKVLHDQKVQDGITFESVVTSANEVIAIDGYNYDSVDKENLTITTGENVINIYYTKRTNLSYKVNYLEKETNKVLHDQKVQEGMTFESTVNSSDEVIDIDGYNYDSVDKATLTIETEENVINIYYTKRTDLSYKVNYLEKETNKVLHDQKVQEGMTFESVVTSANEVIDIDGYNYDSVDKDNLTITTGENVINIYYTKRNDLSYTVNYLEKDTNIVLHEPKVTENMTFEATINSDKEVIDIDGYNYDSVDKETLTITTGENVINIYYTKRNDLSYTVNYLEKGTNKVLNTPKVKDHMTFQTVITSKDEVIKINGYNYDSVDKETLTITTGTNVINVYYTKVTGLSYTVNYLDKNTDEVIHPSKTTGEQVFEKEITSADEVIDIDGYNYDSVDKDKLIIGTGENVINIYYTKRTNLSYTVNYLEKDTNKVLHEQKNQTGMTFGDIITSSDEIINIDGYNYNSVDKNSISIGTKENVINIYYTKRTDLSYKVNYLEKTTNKVLHDQKVQGGMTFESVVTSANEVIDIDGYNYDSVDKATLTITTGENIINIYYTKRNDLNYTVNYLEKATNKVLHNPKTVENKTFGDVIKSADEKITIDGYNYDSVDKDTLTITTGENVINIYYTKRNDLSYKVNYLEKGTNKVLHDPKSQGNMTFESTVKSSDEVIDIDGYNYDSVDKDTLTITTGENVINIYYTKRNDLSYKVNYLEKGTNKVLHDQKVQNGMTFETEVKSADEVIDINGYKYDSADKESIKITTGENVINIYYTKVDGLSYTVNYLDKNTNEVINPAKTKDGMTFEDVVTSRDEIIPIDGYNYDSVDKDTLTIGTGENVINIYYTKRTDLSYKVNYLEKGTNKVLHDQKVQENMTFKATVKSSDEVIDIDGYNYDSVDKDTLMITTGENVINIYYTKRTDLSYKVNYLEKGTNKVLHDQKVQDGMTFESVVTSANEVIDIDGYNYDSVDKDTLIIGTGENVINIYYTKRNDLSYKVNYLEKGTNKVLHNQKVQDGMTFESVVTSTNEVIDIDGYNYDSVDKDTLTITTGENIINIYYTKRNDLSYTVNYLEKDTNIVLHEPKITDNMTFESVITSANEVIDIDGYNYDSVDKETLTITTGENVINIYYAKRNDLSYTVNYLEKDTNRTIYAPKVIQNMTFGTEITTSKEVIAINGYSYDSVDKDTLTIGTGENVINIYYTKVSGLSYTVNYLEKDTNEVLQAPKTTGDMTFEDEIISSNEIIDIDGYNYDSVDKDKLVIGTGENVINIYYTKRNDLSYKVNYLEKDTNKVLHDQKTQDGMTFESVVTSADEVIDIDGYNYDSVDKETLTITTEENVINIYYTKRTDLSYTVNYLEKDTNNVLHEQKVQDGMTFESVVNSSDEVIDIYGYNYDSVDKDTITITTGENVINIYYTKKDTKVTVHYYEEGTTNKVSEDVEIPGKVFDDYTTTSADDIPSKYELVAEPENKNGTMTEDEITVIYYYRKKATQVIVHYYEENTTKKLSEDVTINGRVDDKYTTVSANDIPIKYELVATPSNANGSMTEETIEVIYYYRVKDAVVHVRYLEKGTDQVLADPDRLDGKVDDNYQTEAKVIDGYQLVEHTGNEKGKFEVEPITITYYYLYKTKATVQYIDKTTGAILEQSTTEGLEGDDFVTESKDFENYVLVEEPAEKTVKMTKEEQILKYYYIHVSGGVIEKHIDVISGQILANAVHNGNEGDEYDIPSRTFDGYDLVEDRLPSNAKGTMKVEPVEVIYYYIYRSKVISEYIDKNTGEKLTEDVTQKGHEGDKYTTDRKTFDDYKLVEVPSNADGSMTKENITVTYYYVHISGGVIVNHIDIKTGKQLLDETKEEGYEGDPYETHEENIPEYDLVKEKYPENAVGKMTIEPTRVTYYYIKKTEVNVKYVDSETGEEIDESTNIPGHEGDDYTTEPKDVPGYDLVEEPENKDGTMTADPIDVIYYYKRPAKVIVNYYDINTKEKLADEIEITGHQNDDYTTEQKDIKYYEIAKVPENKDGKMVVTVTKDENGKEIVEDTTYVNYYYRKLIFNLRVDKTIASVIVNGQETAINGNLGKVEVHRKNISTANVKVVYKIKVTNDSELTGKANIVENIPSGMTMIADNNPGWTINETTASIETDEVKPGESREYQVVLGWQNGDSNVGTKENVASIVTENEAGFEEKDKSDNESKADLIVAVGTGEVPYIAIAGSILLIMIAITSGIYVIKKKHQ